MLVSIGYELVFCFSPCVSDPFLPTIKLVAWVETFFFLRAAQGHILAKTKHFVSKGTEHPMQQNILATTQEKTSQD